MLSRLDAIKEVFEKHGRDVFFHQKQGPTHITVWTVMPARLIPGVRTKHISQEGSGRRMIA